MTDEKFHLTWPSWHSYSDHLKEMMHIMKMDDTFTDVTLVSDDGRKVRAHKAVLGASSPIMKDMMIRENTSIVDLKGIALEEIDAILHFVYLGEATLHPERMKKFLDAVQMLKVKELCKKSKMEFEQINTINFEDVMYSSEQYNKDCTKQSNVTSTYGCSQCDKQFSTKIILRRHIKSLHKKYACNQCDRQFTRQDTLTTHIQSKHEGVKYTCSQCDYQTGYQSHLRRHIQNVHKLV